MTNHSISWVQSLLRRLTSIAESIATVALSREIFPFLYCALYILGYVPFEHAVLVGVFFSYMKIIDIERSLGGDSDE